MKKIILLIQLFYCLISYSQKGYVEYGYIESLGLGNALGLDYNSSLYFDKNNSYYVTKKENLETPEKIAGTKVVEEDGEIKAVFNGMGVSNEGNQVYYSNNQKKMYSSLFFKNRILVDDGFINIEWKINTETKKIGNFSCIKATTTFRGRNYTAWFTTDIPVPYGPWKLNNLPGLILEAYDEDKYVYWYFKNIEFPSMKSQEIESDITKNLNSYINYTSFKQFQQKELIKIEEKNAMLMKEIPSMKITSPKLNELFIECE